MTTHKTKILERVKAFWKAETNNDLMNKLQDNGKISDLCMCVDDIPDSDLMRFYNQTIS